MMTLHFVSLLTITSSTRFSQVEKMAASRTGVVGVPLDVDVTCVLSFTSAFPTQHRWVMIKTNFQPKIWLKQPNALTQRSQPSIWVEKTTQRFLECRNIAKLRNRMAEKLVHAFMTSRLDYCNALLGGCPSSSINKLQIVKNAAARVLIRSRKYDHITPILQSLHWLPIKFRISYKILLLAYKALNYLAPAYCGITNCI